MTTENNGSTSVAVIMQEENPSFLGDKVQLQKLLKEVSKASKEAIEVLVKLLESKDERVAMQAATKLLEFQVSIAKEISEDQMKRLIAEIKLNRSPKGVLIPIAPESEEAKKKRPIVDFATIRTV